MVLGRPTRPSRTNTPKDILFILGDWNAKVGSQEIPGVTEKFALEVRTEAGQRLTVFPKGKDHIKDPLPTIQEKTLVLDTQDVCGHHQMVNTEIRLIIFFAPKDEDALYNQQKKTGS